YGHHAFGRCCLLARRLVEAGVSLVQVNWPRDKPDDEQTMWDCHYMLPTSLRRNMPPMDQGYTALLEDLEQRGLLDETLVVWVGGEGPDAEVREPAEVPRAGPQPLGPRLLGGAGRRGGARRHGVRRQRPGRRLPEGREGDAARDDGHDLPRPRHPAGDGTPRPP